MDERIIELCCFHISGQGLFVAGNNYPELNAIPGFLTISNIMV